MKLIYDERPIEESTALFTFSFKDEEGKAVNLKTLTWSLTNSEGVVVNNRDEEEVTNPGSTVKILLHSSDLALIGDDDDGFRILTLQGTYDSDNGTDLPLIDQVGFYIERVTAVLV